MVRVAVIGCSNIGQGHARRFLEVEDAELVAVCDLRPEALEEMRDQVLAPAGSDAALYTDFDELLGNEQLDAVDLILPHALHYPLASKALDRGLHVLLEKPMVTEVAHAEALVEQVQRTGKLLQIAFQSVYTGQSQVAREQIRAGKLGTVQQIVGYLYQDWVGNVRRKPQKAWRLDPAVSGGGQLYDSGSHLLNLMLWVSELRPVEVFALVENRDQRVDLFSSLSIRFENRALGSVAVSGDGRKGLESYLYLNGTAGEIRMNQYGGALSLRGASGEDLPIPDAPDSSPQQNFVDALAGRAEPRCPVEYGLRLARLMDAVYRSAESGELVRVNW